MGELTSIAKQEAANPKTPTTADRAVDLEASAGTPRLDGAALTAAAAPNRSGPPAPPLAPWQLLQWQGAAGNHAVAELIGRRYQRSPAQRTVSPSSSPAVLESPRPAEPVTERATQIEMPAREAPVAPVVMRSTVVQRSIGDSILGKVADWAKEIPGYHLLTLVLGKDPISGATVERNAMNVVHGILSIVPGGNKIFENLQQSGALERFFDWVSGEFPKLGLSFDSIKQLFLNAWHALSVTDLLDPAGAWDKIKGIFGPPLGRIKDFAIAAGKKVLEFILEGVLKLAGPLGEQVMAMLKKGADIFNKIVEDPIGFLGNLLKAIKGGFEGFMNNILEHLKNGLMGWLFGALAGAGLVLPRAFDLKGILSIVLQVLGLTYANLRGKLVAALGEKTVAYIETAVDFVKTLITEGLAGAWKMIVQWAGNLWEMVIGAIQDWVVASIVKSAVAKLITMFNPVGAIIQGIITIYNTISFFIERAQQIAAVASSMFDSVGRIAAGDVSGAAAFVEQTMAKSVPVMISFLASLIGLGGIANTIRGIIGKIQAPINKALDKTVGFIASKAKSLAGKVKGLFGKGIDKVKSMLGLKKKEVSFQGGGEGHRIFIDATGGQPRLMIASDITAFNELLDGLKKRLGELDPAQKTKAEESIEKARTVGATALGKAKEEAAAENESAPDVTTPALETLVPILVELFNLFPKDKTKVAWDAAQVKIVLSDVTAAVQAAKQARQSRRYADQALSKLTPAEKAFIAGGEFGVGTAVYTDANDKVHKVGVLNNIAIGLRMNGDMARAAYERLIREATDVLKGEDYEVLESSGTFEEGKQKSGTHEEVLLRNYLQQHAATLVPGSAIPFGVSQATICGDCVYNLANGKPPPTKKDSSESKTANVATGPVQQDVDAAEMQTIVAAGHDLAKLLG